MKQHFCMGMTVRNVYIIQMKNAYIIMTVNHRATIVITTRQKLEIEKLLVVRNGQFFLNFRSIFYSEKFLTPRPFRFSARSIHFQKSPIFERILIKFCRQNSRKVLLF